MNQLPEQQPDPLEQYYEYPDSQLLKIDIRQSKLANSGMGMFARSDIENGQHITEYYGSIMHTKNSLDRQFWHEDKMVQIDEQYCVISRAPCSRANDIVKWEPQRYKTSTYSFYRKSKSLPKHSGVSHNAKIKIVGRQKAFLTATRKIFAGEQIHIDYGFEYWDFFYNLQPEAKTSIF